MDYINIKRTISGYLSYRGESLVKVRETLKTIIDEPLVLEIIVKEVDNYGFRKIVKDFSLAEKYVEMRENYEREIVNNYEDYNLESVQQSLCDLLFENNKQNVKLTIQTIKERAQYCEYYNELYSKNADLFERVLTFLNMEQENYDKDLLSSLLSDISQMNKQIEASGDSIYNITTQLFKHAEKGFEKELSLTIEQSAKTMFSGLTPEIVETENGHQVKIFKMQNQTENQRQFCILSRTMYVSDYLTKEGAMEKYKEEMSKKDYLSFSVINQSKNSGFASRHRTQLGFFSVGMGEMMSCNTHDGQTNQYTISKGKYVMRQEFLPISQFMEHTTSYNEVVLDNPETILPSVVISSTATPDEQTLKVATALNIPILFIDETCYDSYTYSNDASSEELNQEYSYETFLKHQLGQLKSADNEYNT